MGRRGKAQLTSIHSQWSDPAGGIRAAHRKRNRINKEEKVAAIKEEHNKNMHNLCKSVYLQRMSGDLNLTRMFNEMTYI